MLGSSDDVALAFGMQDKLGDVLGNGYDVGIADLLGDVQGSVVEVDDKVGLVLRELISAVKYTVHPLH